MGSDGVTGETSEYAQAYLAKLWRADIECVYQLRIEGMS